jgi:DNA primase catalytic subunit
MASDEERRIEILQYVMYRQLDNQRTTKANVIRHLKEKKMASGETTHNILKDLIIEGKLNRQEINTQLHYLTINEENEFNKTYNMLTELKTFMNMMDKILDIHKINLNELAVYTAGKQHEEYLGAREFDDHLVNPYLGLLETIFQNMLIRIVRSKTSDKDRLMLSARTLDLLNKLTYNYYKTSDANSYLKDKVSKIMENVTGAEHIQDYAKKYGIDLNIIDNLRSIVEKFRKFNT